MSHRRLKCGERNDRRIFSIFEMSYVEAYAYILQVGKPNGAFACRCCSADVA